LRLQLSLAATRGLAVLAVAGVALPARAEDRVTVRGAYYREASTKVVQPVVQVTKDLPSGFDVSVHGLVDAITSPSQLTGVQGDNIFTEYRKEAGLVVGKSFGHGRVGLSYKESREPDYVSHSFGLQLSRGVWENSGALGLSLAYSTDAIGPNLDLPMQAYFASLAYTQALSPVSVVEVAYEATYLHGYLCNPYDQDARYGRGRAMCPPRRLRHVAVVRVAHYFPDLATGVQLHYRFYYDQWPGSLAAQPGASDLPGPPSDPWTMASHTFEARLYRELMRGLELRLAYRFHSQGAARFRECTGNPSLGVQPGCEGIPVSAEHATDEKLTAFSTHVVEVKLYWEARPLAGIPVLAWFALGGFDISYGHYFQPTHYADAHVLQTGYSLPF
jgi:hypothetical protein